MRQKKTQNQDKPKKKTKLGQLKNFKLTRRKVLGLVGLVLGFVVTGAIGFFMIDVDQTKEARLPGVNVDQGQLPKFKLNIAKISLGTKTIDVKMPTIGMKTELVEVKVPKGVEVGSKKIGIKLPSIEVRRGPQEIKTASNP